MNDNDSEVWGPWHRNPGGGMPVPAGMIVDVFTLAKTRDGLTRKVGIAGIDLTASWNWTRQTRDTHPAAPIDFYRMKRPRGLRFLFQCLEDVPDFEDA